jgi:hypothetical protein
MCRTAAKGIDDTPKCNSQMLPRSARHGGSLWIFFGPAHFNPLPLDDLVGEEFIDELKVVWLNNLLVSGG